MAEKEFIFTKEGYDELEKKLEYLKTVKRYEISEQIKHAREFGDISENAEYDEAKNEQAKVEKEILIIEEQIKYAKIVTDADMKRKVTILDVEENEEMQVQIVGTTEADPYQNKLSNESPVGAALIGKKKNQVVDVETPAGVLQFKILKID